MATRSTLVTGFFKNRTAAEAAFDVLLKRGYPREEISLLMSDETRTKTFGLASGTHAAEGATAGGVLGGTVGGVLAAVAAVGTNLALPGLGLVIAGPIAAALAGIGAGTVTGGLVGALVGAGIPEHRAKVYESGIRSGGILIGVGARSDQEADEIERVLEEVGAEHVRQK